MDIEKAVKREVAHMLRGWNEITDRSPEQEKMFEIDTVEAIRIARERATVLAFECPDNLPKVEHYGALDPNEREG